MSKELNINNVDSDEIEYVNEMFEDEINTNDIEDVSPQESLEDVNKKTEKLLNNEVGIRQSNREKKSEIYLDDDDEPIEDVMERMESLLHDDEQLLDFQSYANDKSLSTEDASSIIYQQIEAKKDEIENLQMKISYIESGEAYRIIEMQYDSGAISEEKYKESKRKIDNEIAELEEKIQQAVSDLKDLEHKRELEKEKEKIKSEIEEIEKEIEEIDLKIQEKGDEIENFQTKITYIESGEAYRAIQMQYDSGAISEDEYNEKKEKINAEHKELLNDMETTVGDLKDLKEKKGILIEKKQIKEDSLKNFEAKENIKQKNKVDEKVETDLDFDLKDEKVEDGLDFDPEDEKVEDGLDFDPEDEKVEDGLKFDPKDKKNKEELKFDSKDDKYEEIEPNNEEKQLEVYKKPNRLVSFFRNIIQKIKNIGKKDNNDLDFDFEDEKVEDGLDFDPEDDEYDFDDEFEIPEEPVTKHNTDIGNDTQSEYEKMNELERELYRFLNNDDLVYSPEDIVKNMRNRDSKESQVQKKDKSEDNQII